MAMKIISVTEIDGFKLGNAENSEKGTGCTVIVCEEGAVGGVDVRGGGPATRETDLLRSENTVNAVNAVVLSGGSAFGLEAASGVMRELADRNIGFNVGDDIYVPIVCGASLYDLPVGDSNAFPDINMGIQAVRNAYSGSFVMGNHGAGTGATVGKLKGYERAMKSGLGSFACGDGIVEVGAIAAVNAVGDIYNGAGKIIAGLRSEDGKSIYGTIKTLKGMVHDKIRLVDDSTSFINKYDIEEALAAAAKQYEEEEAAAEEAEAAAANEPVEKIAEEAVEDISEEAEPEEAVQEDIFDDTPEEPVEDISEEAEPEEAVQEEVFEEAPEEPAEVEAAEEPEEEEFIPETPPVNAFDDNYRGYDEISIPSETVEAANASFAVSEEPEVCEEEPAEECVEPAHEQVIEEFTGEAEEEYPEAPEEPVEEIAEAFESEEPVQEEAFDEAPEEPIEENSDVDSEPAEEFVEPVPEQVIEEFTEEAEEKYSESPEEPVEEIVEEPVVLSREDMGYDIVFNTTISCLITNAALTKSQANKLASILHDAYARAIKPVHGTLDGDTVFVLSTGKQEVNFDAFAALATDVMQYAVIDGAMSAEGAYGLPCAKDMQK